MKQNITSSEHTLDDVCMKASSSAALEMTLDESRYKVIQTKVQKKPKKPNIEKTRRQAKCGQN